MARLLLLAALAQLVPAAALAAAPAVPGRTDAVVLRNGDHFTGEVKALDRGRLKLETDDAGTLSIEWNKVARLTAAGEFDVETADGSRYFGALGPAAAAGILSVVPTGEGAEAVDLDLESVVRIDRLRRTIWHRIEGSLDLGASYAASSGVGQFNLNSAATYRERRFQLGSTLTSALTYQDGEAVARRNVVTLEYQRFRPGRWYGLGAARVEQNPDLGFDLRAGVAGGVGRYLVQTNRSLLTAAGALGVSRERPVTGEAETNYEAILGASYSTFTYDFPKVTVEASLYLVPSLSESGRVRVEASAAVKREIVRDFYVSVSGYESYDSESANTEHAENDWGWVASIGWSF
jgi:hypothetical protein